MTPDGPVTLGQWAGSTGPAGVLGDRDVVGVGVGVGLATARPGTTADVLLHEADADVYRTEQRRRAVVA